MFYLVIKNGKNTGKRISFPPQGELLIGRGSECQLRLASTDVSRKHCRLRVQGESVTVEDLGSQNGTFLDGFLIQALVQLRPDSVLRVGTMEFQVKRAGSAKAEPAKPIAKDDDIAAWLTEEGETNDVNLDESTIIPKNSPPQKPQEPPPGQISLHPDSETAAEIIQQHWKAKFQS
ncbi:MAG TPA: FHA domain-containing protein [Planctomycetaceae bacterium]|nr:FHA domain-containing protein [Planctomycetaceae bacterium]